MAAWIQLKPRLHATPMDPTSGWSIDLVKYNYFKIQIEIHKRILKVPNK